MRSYMKDGRCTVCGAYRTDATLERFQRAVAISKAQALSSGEIVECCPVPDYIGLRAFATAYYGKIWYVNPRKHWSRAQLQAHYEEIMFISKMYHLYRFGNYRDLKKYFADYDNGDLVIANITKEVLPAYQECALDPDIPMEQWPGPGNDLGRQSYLTGLEVQVVYHD